MIPIELHPSTREVLRRVREIAPDAPFLTLGQTVFWDEPLKAAFFAALRAFDPQARMTAGVHDTDYFAKLPGGVKAPANGAPFVMLGHNDGDTRGLWSAAGEISSLFGSETVVTRADLGESGVAVERVARDYQGGLDTLLSRETQAWGWRALVHAGPGTLIAANVKLSQVGAALREQLAWAFAESGQIVDATQTRDLVLSWVDDYSAANPNGTLSDLYEHLTPRLWAMVGGESGHAALEGLQTSRSTELFRFNAGTCSLPRWNFLDLFLNPATRATAVRCYNDAVRGSGIYTLDEFGPGALPFDVVVPGRGRGTLRLHRGSVFIETKPAIEVCANCDPSSLAELAALLEAEFGSDVVIVGKAVALISMLSAEYVFVFHERASGYTARTQAMNAQMRARGLELPLLPMVRFALSSWSALGDSAATLRLPSHLATAFGAETVSASDFSSRWQQVCDEQDALRGELRAARSARALMQLLSEWRGEAWQTRLREYQKAREVLLQMRPRTLNLEGETAHLREQARDEKQRAAQLELQKGDDFRASLQPLRERVFDLKESGARRLVAVGSDGKPIKVSKEERAAQNEQLQIEAREIADLRAQIAKREEQRRDVAAHIAAHRQRARELSEQANALVRERAILEHGALVTRARAEMARLEREADREKLRLVRDSLWVSRGLRYTNVRPTAWWLPIVSPRGAWFRALVSGAQARLEEL